MAPPFFSLLAAQAAEIRYATVSIKLSRHSPSSLAFQNIHGDNTQSTVHIYLPITTRTLSHYSQFE